MVPTRCLISMGGDHRLVVIEQFFTTFIIFRSSEVSIPQPLVDARFHRVGNIGGFTLDHPKGRPLTNNRISGMMFCLTLSTFTQILFHRDQLHHRLPDVLICFHQGKGFELNQKPLVAFRRFTSLIHRLSRLMESDSRDSRTASLREFLSDEFSGDSCSPATYSQPRDRSSSKAGSSTLSNSSELIFVLF